jgi:hypothetical protein
MKRPEARKLRALATSRASSGCPSSCCSALVSWRGPTAAALAACKSPDGKQQISGPSQHTALEHVGA